MTGLVSISQKGLSGKILLLSYPLAEAFSHGAKPKSHDLTLKTVSEAQGMALTLA